MTYQISETIKLGGHDFSVEEFAHFPKSHPLLIDDEAPVQKGKKIPRLPKNSACHRHYVGSWRIDEKGSLFLCQISGRYRMRKPEIAADWYSGTIAIPIGEEDRTESLKFRFQTKREALLELCVKQGTVTRWRYASAKSIDKTQWIDGYDAVSIIAMLETACPGEDFQPPPVRAKRLDSLDDQQAMIQESALLLRRAKGEQTKLGATVLQPDDWRVLRRGFGDPSPELPLHQAIMVLRRQSSTPDSKSL